MTYHDQEFLVSQASEAQSYNKKQRVYNNRNKNWYSSRYTSPEPLRVECKAEERHYIGNITSHQNIDSHLKPIRFTMNDQLQPTQFRSEIVVHNNLDTDLHIQRLHVTFYCYDDAPENAGLNQGTMTPAISSPQSFSVDMSKPSPAQIQQGQKGNDLRKKSQFTTSNLPNQSLHQWVDDICNHRHLLQSDNIVFFIKNGEFFARI